MSFSFKNSKRAVAMIFAIGCLGLGLCGPGFRLAHCRSIEFSDPTESDAVTNLNALVEKNNLPLLDNIYAPSSLGTVKPRGSLKPLPPQMRIVNSANRGPNEKNWAQMTPGEMMNSMVERDILKTSSSEPGMNGSDFSFGLGLKSQAARRNAVTNRFGALEMKGSFGETNRADNGSDVLKDYDPFGSYNGKRNLPDSASSTWISAKPDSIWNSFGRNDENSPETIKVKKAQTERAETFKKFLESQTPATPSARPPANIPGLTALENNFGSASGVASPISRLIAPAAPIAPIAPLAPGQLSLPAYSPPPKPKPTGFDVPKRKF